MSYEGDTRRIEIEFPVAVEIPDAIFRRLADLIGEVCSAYEVAHPDRVMWPAGFGCKPHWSAADAAFLGKPVEPGAPAEGEPTFDDSVLYLEVAERERYDHETLSAGGES